MNQKGFISIIFIIAGAAVVALTTFGVVKYKGKTTANISQVFGSKVETSNVKSTIKDKISEESKPSKDSVVREKSELRKEQGNAQKLREQLRRTEQKQLELEKQLAKEKAKQKTEQEKAEIKRANDKRLRDEQERQERQEKIRIKQEIERTKAEMENGLNRLYIQSTLYFIKTSADHLVNIAALLASKFNILIDGRDRCSKNYDTDIAKTREEGQKRIDSELEARKGFSTNSALIQQMKEDLENDIADLQESKKRCMAAYPMPDPTIKEKIKQEVVKLDNLYSRVSAGTNSVTIAINMLQEYNSIEARIISFKNYIPSPLRPVSIQPVLKPLAPTGSFRCTISPTGNSYSCSDSFSNTTILCQLSPTGSSWGCRSSDGGSIRCQRSPTGNSIGCSFN